MDKTQKTPISSEIGVLLVVDFTGRGERTRQPLADLNQPEAGKCAEGAQASSENCFLLAYGEYPPLADSDSILTRAHP